MSRVRLLAPAKVNLGLAILGKRADGYHEIDSVMAMVGLYDELIFTAIEKPGITIAGMDDVPTTDNLVCKAAERWFEAAGIHGGVGVEISKHIPSPGGLGGGSSDAAATLTALELLFGAEAKGGYSLHELAASLGADCPFFLSASPTQRAQGIGTDLESVPSPSGWVVLITPAVEIAAKTARLYSMLTPEDYGSTNQADKIVASLEAGALPDNTLLANSFDRAVNTITPCVARTRSLLRDVGINVALSGAGPTLYALAADEAAARQMAVQAQNILETSTVVQIAPFLDAVPTPEHLP